MTDSTGTSSFVYDELDRLTSSTDSFGKQVQYGYDITGNRTGITYPSDSNNPARTVVCKYDKANRLDKITDWADRIWDYTVDGAGRITQLIYPNGVKELRSYDNAGRLASLAYKKSDDTIFISYTYTRDGQGNPKNISETGTLPANPKLPVKVGYTYDEDNRLVETDEPASYSYDNNGNLIGRTVNGVATTFDYDFENRLVSQTTNGSTVQHIYDGRGNRIARIDNGTATRYVLDYGRDMSHVLCETDGSGEITAYYIHGPQIAGRIGTDGSVRYYHSDHIGNIVALTDGSQNITDKYAYTPFGIPAGKQGTTVNPFTFVGGLGVMAENDGLYFMRARFYEADAGRFLSKDPIEGRLMEPMSLHRYAYSLNNSIVFTDPLGMYAWDTMWSGLGQVGLGALDVAGGYFGIQTGGLLVPVGIGIPMTLKAGNTGIKGVTEIFSGIENITYQAVLNNSAVDKSKDLVKEWILASENEHLMDAYNAMDASLDVINLIKGFTGKTNEYIRNIITVINSSRSLINKISWENNVPCSYGMDASEICYYIKLQ
jgi:RHS repeat-associated protein